MLTIEGLDVPIVGTPVLRGIDLSVGPAEMVCVVGRNGAGKTTLLRALMGQLTPSRGRIVWNGRALVGLTPFEIARRGIGYSPEESDVFCDLTVAQNVAFGTWTRKTALSPEDRIERAYDIFPNLRRYMARGGGELSGGERKMVSIARALALDPEILVLDEPFEGLSPAIVPTIVTAIAAIRASGMSILMAESNVQHIPDYASQVCVIERGEIVFRGDLEAARNDPSVKQIVSGLA
jgi:branched-chain amino acid transport system ATP-binding protein